MKIVIDLELTRPLTAAEREELRFALFAQLEDLPKAAPDVEISIDGDPDA